MKLLLADKVSSDKVTALTFNESAVNDLTKYKVNEVLHIKNNKLFNYNPLTYAKVLESLISEL